MLKHISSFCRDEEGTTAIEYALIAALVSVAAITAFTQLGTNLNAMFASVASKLGPVAAALNP